MGFTGMDRLDDLPIYKLTPEDQAVFAQKVREIDAEIAQAPPRSDEYGERVLEASDVVIAESVYGNAGSAGVQVNAAGEV